jgi:hypothetical protein
VLLKSRKCGISVVFNKNTKLSDQKLSVVGWHQTFRHSKSFNSEDFVMRHMFWNDNSFHEKSKRVTTTLTSDISSYLMGLMSLNSTSSKRLAYLTIVSTTTTTSTESDKVHQQVHLKWQEWTNIAINLIKNQSHLCGMDDMFAGIQHRHRSLYFPFSRSLIASLRQSLLIPSADNINRTTEVINGVTYESSQITAACFAHFISVVAADHRVARFAISRPMQTQNHNARQITQIGGFGEEPYSAVGLTGQNMVIGISDTGIDERSCFFRDEVNGEVKYTDDCMRTLITCLHNCDNLHRYRDQMWGI